MFNLGQLYGTEGTYFNWLLIIVRLLVFLNDLPTILTTAHATHIIVSLDLWIIIVHITLISKSTDYSRNLWQSKRDKIIKIQIQGYKGTELLWKGAKGQTCKFKELVYQLILYVLLT